MVGLVWNLITVCAGSGRLFHKGIDYCSWGNIEIFCMSCNGTMCVGWGWPCFVVCSVSSHTPHVLAVLRPRCPRGKTFSIGSLNTPLGHSAKFFVNHRLSHPEDLTSAFSINKHFSTFFLAFKWKIGTFLHIHTFILSDTPLLRKFEPFSKLKKLLSKCSAHHV